MQQDSYASTLLSRTPRHVDLTRTLMKEIAEGRPPVGELLPTESELCATWGLSRYAVRQAVQKLCDLGLVTRQAGVGTRVVADRPQTRYTQAMDTLTDLMGYVKDTTLRTTAFSSITADASNASLLRCEAGTRWLHLAGVRHAGGPAAEPISLVDIYVAPAYGDLPALKKTLHAPVYALIEQRYGIKVTRVEQEVRGCLIEGEQAAVLRVPDKSAGLWICRTYFHDDRIIEVTTGLHPASRFSYTTTFQIATL